MKQKVLGAIGLLAVLVIGVWFYFTPHLALHGMKAAADARDAVKLADYVNFPALKESLKGTFNAKLASMVASDPKKDPSTALAGAFIGMMIGPMVDALVTPEGLATMMQGEKPKLGGAPSGSSQPALGQEVSHGYETFDRFVVTVKNTTSADPVQLVLTRDGMFSWKLSAVRISL